MSIFRMNIIINIIIFSYNFRRELTKYVRKSKYKYYKDKISEPVHKPIQFWKTVREFSVVRKPQNKCLIYYFFKGLKPTTRL